MHRTARALLLLALLPAGLSASASSQDADMLPGQSRALVITGANNHHWEFTSRLLVEMLSTSGKFQVDLTADPAATLAEAETVARYQVLVLDYNGPRWGEQAEQNFVEAVRGGTGVVVVHAANNAFPGWVEYEQIVGHLWREGSGHGRFHPFDVEITDRDHPVTRELMDIRAHPDELYHGLVNVHGTSHRVLAVAESSKESDGSGESEPMIMVGAFGAGRVFHTALGHVWRGSQFSRESFRDVRFQDLIVRGAEWAATGEVTVQTTPPNTLSELEQVQGWQLLFDGESTRGWRGFKREGFPEQGWEVRDGCLVVTGGGGDLITEATFADFDLDLEFKVAPGANSGIIYRVTEEADATWHTGPEFQVLDDSALGEFPDLKHSVGALYDMVAPPLKVVRPPGAWNRARITVRDWKIEHWLNGFRVAEADMRTPTGAHLIAFSKFAQLSGFARAARGHIALQDHGDEVWFRSIKLVDRSERPGLALFNGQDLSGWTAHLEGDADPADVWSVEDGVLICKGTPNGYLRTEQDYASYVLRLEWRWGAPASQGGNSGVLLRVHGPDKVWPKSIEAQLESGSAGDFWLNDGFPMNTAAKRTKGRQARATHHNENELGLWNEAALVVDGGKVSLWINGELVNQGTGALAVPGKIALQSEGGEIHFRNVFLTPLR